MDYAEILRDAWAFTRQGVFENVGRWIRLVLATILIAIPMNGYMMRIYRGAESAPEVDAWGQMSMDGLKLMVVSFIYSIPIWLVWLATYGAMMAGIFTGQISDAALSAWEPNMGLIVLMYVIEFTIALVLPVVAIRFARSNRFSEAFNFRGIFDHMAKIGWINYVLAIILVAIIVAVPVMALVFVFIILGIVIGVFTGFSITAILGMIALAVLVFLILAPLFMVFQARCWTRIYDSVTPVG